MTLLDIAMCQRHLSAAEIVARFASSSLIMTETAILAATVRLMTSASKMKPLVRHFGFESPFSLREHVRSAVDYRRDYKAVSDLSSCLFPLQYAGRCLQGLRR